MTTLNASPAPTRAEEIIAILRDEILRGQYRPGERLPSERDLAARFESNRGSVREALKKLEQLGIAAITPGGVRVIPIEEASLSVLGPLVDLQEEPDPLLVSHLLEVLGALLSMAARSAVDRATDAEVEEMRSVVSGLIASIGDSDLQHQGWRSLGTLFAQISDNLVLRLILNGLKAQFTSRLEARSPRQPLSLDDEQHRATLLQLERGLTARDSQCVASTIQQHFDQINRNLQNHIARAQESAS